MIRFYFHPTPNPAKVALFLEETGLPYEASGRYEQRRAAPVRLPRHQSERQGPGDRGYGRPRRQGSARVRFHRDPDLSRREDRQAHGRAGGRPELLSWLMFIASGLGPFSGQAVHFQFAAPEGSIMRSTATAARPNGITSAQRSPWRREFIVGDAIPSPTCRPGAGSAAPRALSRARTTRSRHIPRSSAGFSGGGAAGGRPRAPSGKITTSRRSSTKRPSGRSFPRTTRRPPSHGRTDILEVKHDMTQHTHRRRSGPGRSPAAGNSPTSTGRSPGRRTRRSCRSADIRSNFIRSARRTVKR